MSEPKFSESESDLSSNSSWTILDDNADTKSEPNHPEEQAEDENVKTIPSPETEERLEIKCSHSSISRTSMKENQSGNASDNAFLTFDEYLQERMIEYDLDDDQNSTAAVLSEKEAKQKFRKKCKAETIHILSMTCSLLVLTGLSLLCVLFPHNANDKIIHSIERSLPSIADADTCDISQAVAALNGTADMVNIISESNILDKIKADLTSDGQMNAPQTMNELYTQDEKPNFDESEEYKVDEDIIEGEEEYEDTATESEQENDLPQDTNNWDASDPMISTFDSTHKSRLSAFKEFLSRTNILTIISCVMHNICVFKLVKHLCKKQEVKEQAKSGNNTSEKVKFQVPEGKSQETKVVPKTGSKRKVKLSKINKKIVVREMPVRHVKPFPVRLSDHLMRPQISFNFTALDTTECVKQNMNSNKTNGVYGKSLLNEDKGEETRPKSRELERYKRKTEIFTEQHRKKIKFLKNEFHQELADAKKKQLESAERSKRISAIKENFILRLKQHREKYLNELKVLKEERQHLLKELCSNKHQHGTESKDVAVGNYVVPLTGLCGFQEKLRMLKEKESRNKPIAKKSLPLFSNIQSDSSNKLYPYQSSPCFKIEKLKMEKYIPFHRTFTREAQRKKSLDDNARDQRDRLTEMRQQYLKKQTEILDEYSRMISDEVTRMEIAGDKMVEPCISLLDEIILEAVDTVQKKKDSEPRQTEVALRECTSIVKSKPKLKVSHDTEETDSTCSTGTPREDMQDIVTESTKTTRNLLKKLDLYTALFEKQAKNIRIIDTQKLKQEYPEVPRVKHLSKQDPQRCYIERIISRHH